MKYVKFTVHMPLLLFVSNYLNTIYNAIFLNLMSQFVIYTLSVCPITTKCMQLVIFKTFSISNQNMNVITGVENTCIVICILYNLIIPYFRQQCRIEMSSRRKTDPDHHLVERWTSIQEAVLRRSK